MGPHGRYHELLDTRNCVCVGGGGGGGGGEGGGQLGMGTVSVYIWQPIFSNFKVWQPAIPEYGFTYCQSIAAHISRVWLHIFPEYGCTYFRSMAAHISEVWLHIFQKYVSHILEGRELGGGGGSPGSISVSTSTRATC